MGDSVLVRMRSSSLALLGLIAAVALGLIAVVSSQDWPLVPGNAIPKPPVAPRSPTHRANAPVAGQAHRSAVGSGVALSPPGPAASGGVGAPTSGSSRLSAGRTVAVSAPNSQAPGDGQPVGGGGNRPAGNPSGGGDNPSAGQPAAANPQLASAPESASEKPSTASSEPDPATSNGNGKAKGKDKGGGEAEASTSVPAPVEDGEDDDGSDPGQPGGGGNGHGNGHAFGHGQGNGHAWGRSER